MLRKIAFSALTCIALSATPQGGAVHVNRVFQDASGNPVFNPILNPFGIQWSKSITTAGGDLITVGHTNVSGQGENIYLIKYDSDGNVVFQTDYNTSGTQNDYGTSVALDGSGNIYVCGTTDNGGTTDYDVVVLKYNSSGTLQNNTTYAGTSGLNDVATDIVINGGMIFVCAANENTTTGYDYLLLKYNSGLTLQASGTYDYAGLNDIPSGIEFIGSDVFVSGASANSAVDWDYATAKFDATTCIYGTDSRSSISGVGFDQPLAFKKDGSGNMYITGRATTTLGTTDILTVKISPTFSVLWSVSYDGCGLDDVGSSIAIDGSGNVIVGGGSTQTSGVKEIIFLKYNGTNGTMIWQYKQLSENLTGDAFVKALCLNPTNYNIYFIGGEDGNSGSKQVVIGRLNSNGSPSWQKRIQDPTDDILPSDIEYSNNQIFVISVLDSVIDSYLTTSFSELDRDTAKVYNVSGKPICNKNELIVRFFGGAIDTASIDSNEGNTEFGNLEDYLKPTAYNTVTTALVDACRSLDIKAVKIFPGFPTSLTNATSHLGETVPVPDLWAALLLVFPNGTTMSQVGTALQSIPSVVAYSHPNYLIVPDTPAPDDTLYSKQYSIKKNLIYPNAHVNADGAWDLPGINGKKQFRCGVFDCGLNWKHKEFLRLGTLGSSRMVDGWAFFSNVNLKTIPHGGDTVQTFFANYSNHGTLSAGIIMAGRFNYKEGIAGLAGWNYSNGGTGLDMYGLKVSPGSTSDICNAMNASAYTAQNFTSTTAPPYCYGLHLQNHSWSIAYPSPFPSSAGATDTAVMLISEVMHNLNRLKVTLVASRGNAGDSSLQVPATIDDDWVISVGGTGTDGQYIHSLSAAAPHNSTPNGEFNASVGRQIDLAAPASSLLVLSTGAVKDTMYRRYNGTSAAAPHVTGALGLALSYWNDTLPNLKNLSPEDCEWILQLSATDVDLSNYDKFSGFGRLNIGKALQIIQRPFYNIHHVAADSRYSHVRSIGLLSPLDTVTLIERYQDPANQNNWIQPGKYIVKTFTVEANISHNFDIRDTVIASWPRPSSSGTWDLFKNKTLLPRERCKISQISNASGKTWGYIYQVKDLSGNPIGWWPFDTTTARNKTNLLLEYSVLTRNLNFDVGVSERKIDGTNIKLYPNPTTGRQSIDIECEKNCDLTIDLYDLMGRKLRTVYAGKFTPSSPAIQHDVSGLPNSVYFYYIKMNGQSTCRKFIKQ